MPALPVIGLAGGIGSGKSEVAGILAGLGCHVIDSDERARQVLERPGVRAQLRQWWGEQVLNPDGSVNRSEVARIVFTDPKERQRLEALIHPQVRAARAVLIQQARTKRARAVVIDAPLLFEAGVDKECDVVLFIDAPLELRLHRVRTDRGWDAAELHRREQAQLPAEEKRRRSTFVIPNTGNREQLEAAVRQVLDRIAPPKV